MQRGELLKEMVAGFREDCNGILDAAEKAPWGRVIDGLEFEARRLAHRRYAVLLQQAVVWRSKQWRRASAPGCQCGVRMRLVGRMPRAVMSVVGELRFRRRHYYCDACGHSRWPFDEAMGLSGGWTAGAVRLITRAGVRTSFAEARTDLKELAELPVSAETVRRVTEETAQRLVTEPSAGAGRAEESGEAFQPADLAYTTMDGTMVNTLEGWREVKRGALYDQSKARQHYTATLEPAAAFGLMLRRQAQGLRFGRAGEKVAGGDGAEWIWKQMAVNFPTVDHQFLDFYHLSENVHAAAWRIYGEGTPQGRRWAHTMLHWAKHHGGRRLLRALDRSRSQHRTRKARDALDRLRRYVFNHLARMAYPQLQQQGIDIGTGAQESACKNVIGRRLRGGGMRWAPANAEAMARLRAMMYSTGQWDDFWQAWQPHRGAA